MQKLSSTTGHRIEGIDILRGLSIIAVILMHVNQRAPIEKTIIGQWVHPQILSAIFKNGYLGVIVFFVISGFLITSASISRWGSLRNIDIKGFYSIRFARIAPCLILLLCVLSLLHILGVTGFVIDPEKTTLGRAIFSAITFHVNWLEAKRGYLPGSWDVLWSLSVEEAFYLFFPVVCIFVRDKLSLILFMSIFVVLGPFARILSTNEIWQDHSYLSCMDGIALGCMTALFTAKYKLSAKALKKITWLGFVLFIVCILFKKQIFKAGFTDLGLNVTLMEIATALIIVSIHGRLVQGQSNGGKFTWLIRWFGRNSYEIYLTHMFVVTAFMGTAFMDQNGSSTLFIGVLLILGISGILGYFVARYFSEPTNRWIRAKFTPNIIGISNIRKPAKLGTNEL